MLYYTVSFHPLSYTSKKNILERILDQIIPILYSTSQIPSMDIIQSRSSPFIFIIIHLEPEIGRRVAGLNRTEIYGINKYYSARQKCRLRNTYHLQQHS